MILRALKENSCKNFITKYATHNTSTVNNNKINTVLLLICVEEISILSELTPLSSALNIPQGNIKIVSFTKNKPPKTDFLNHPFYIYDFGWNGNINNPHLNEVINSHFDMLINLSEANYTLLNLITLKSKANFKVGISKKQSRLFNFVINIKLKELSLFIQELKKYLQILKKI